MEVQNKNSAEVTSSVVEGALSDLQLPRPSMQLLTDPLYLPQHLGLPIPRSEYAVSVTLPTIDHVLAYENGLPEVANALQSGYPRFVIKGVTAALFEKLKLQLCAPGEDLVAFPSITSATRCLEFVHREFPDTGRVVLTEFPPITACVVSDAAYKRARSYWQHTGEIISARRAEACLNGATPAVAASVSKDTLRERLAELASANASDVSLFPSGMAGLAALQRTVQSASPGIKTAQVGFPYVDTLKLQEKFGAGYFFFSVNGTQAAIEHQLSELDTAAANGQIAAIYCEFPTNPLLTVPPLERLWEISIRHTVPLIVDETLGTLANVRVLPFATAIVTSLTKYVSGEGDVCAGSVIWNPDHPACERLRAHWSESYEDLLYEGDAVALEINSRDFPARMRKINSGAAQLVDYLSSHPQIEALHYPTRDARQQSTYDQFRIQDGGYGGLFSMRVSGGMQASAKVFDALAVSKGPSLGTNFTIACPYTLLAHFQELEYVASLGVLPDLIRVSVGLEEPAELIERFRRALALLD